ncbi:MAG TPA: hypothetical protein VG273_12635 [Bryobacteraceae bacterium]|nr:hypothetical protein [Bryobacteraceae bacterium]
MNQVAIANLKIPIISSLVAEHDDGEILQRIQGRDALLGVIQANLRA